MDRLKKMILASTAAVMLVSAAGCSAQTAEEQKSEAPEQTAEASPAAEAEAEKNTETAEEEHILVAYFSATGTTRGVAEKIASLTGADIYEILPEEPYTEADLNWHDSGSRTSIEQNDPAFRTAIGSDDISLDGYTEIYLGFPIWWGEEPRIMDNFAETHDFDGITVIPFCTSGSSPIGNSGRNLEALAGSGTWLEGRRFGAGASDTEIQEWIESLD